MLPNDGGGFCLGVGLSRKAEIAGVIALVRDVLALAGAKAEDVARIATIESRRGNPVLYALAQQLGIPLVFFSAEALEAETPRLANPSEALFARIGCHGVAEAAALAAAGTKAVLAVEKMSGAHVTAALAAIR